MSTMSNNWDPSSIQVGVAQLMVGSKDMVFCHTFLDLQMTLSGETLTVVLFGLVVWMTFKPLEEFFLMVQPVGIGCRRCSLVVPLSPFCQVLNMEWIFLTSRIRGAEDAGVSLNSVQTMASMFVNSAFALMTIQANLKSLHPSNCRTTNCVELGNCKRSSYPEGNIAFLFYVSLCLLALGNEGVRGSLHSFGADQFNMNDL